MQATTKLIPEMAGFSGSRKSVQAYLSRPKTTEAGPATGIVHEIFGLVDHVKDIANRFAMEGFVTIAPNLYSSDQELSSLFIRSNIATAFGFLQSMPMEKKITHRKGLGDEARSRTLGLFKRTLS